MANIYTRTSKSGTLKYYSNLRINGKRIRKYLGNSLACIQSDDDGPRYEHTGMDIYWGFDDCENAPENTNLVMESPEINIPEEYQFIQ